MESIDPTRMVRITRGAWVPEVLADREHVRLAALLAALPAGAVLSGPTAARLHGMWVGRTDREHITIPAGPRGASWTTAPQRSDIVTHRSILAPEDVSRWQGLPVTSAARTWSDLASQLSVPDLVAAGDAALHLGLVTADDIRLAAVRRARRPGARRARLACELVDGRARSRPESHMRVALVTAGLPRPQVNEAVLDDHGGWLAEPDLAYPEARLAIEYQGGAHADPRRMRKDVARYMDLRRTGWDVLYYTSDQVFTRPQLIVDDVHRVLVARAPSLLIAGARRTRRVTSSVRG